MSDGQDDVWLDCFALERYNLVSKNCRENIKNTRDMEKSSLEMILNAMFIAIDSFADTYMLPPSQVHVGLSEQFGVGCTVSKRLRYKLRHLAVGDVVFHPDGAYLIEACCQLGDEYACLVVPLQQPGIVSPTSQRWKRSMALVAIVPDDLVPARAWHASGKDEFVTLGYVP